MTISLCVLGSGSGGNCTLLVLGTPPRERFALIDCGLSPRATAKRLGPLGVELGDVSEIMLTHLDADHFHTGWLRRIRRHGIRLLVHERHRSRAVHRGLDGRTMTLFRGPFALDDATSVEPVLLAHDALGTVGFVVERERTRLGFATDLGRVPRVLENRFVRLDALAIESNYDRDLQVASARPIFLKRRIMGGLGHLSNEESVEAVTRVDARSSLAHVVTLHLSRQCNDPRLVKRLYAERLPHLLDRLTVTNQHRPTPLLRCAPDGVREGVGRHGEQMTLLD